MNGSTALTANRDVMAAQDRMDTVATCWAALTDLMSPGCELSAPVRDNIAVLMGFLEAEYQAARRALTLAVRSA